MQDYRKLLVWQRAHELALLVYRLTKDFPKEETFGLRNSLRKTSVDIPARIAEGCGQIDGADFRRALSSSIGFANRLEYFALLARDLEMLNDPKHEAIVSKTVEVRKMLSGLTSRLEN